MPYRALLFIFTIYISFATISAAECNPDQSLRSVKTLLSSAKHQIGFSLLDPESGQPLLEINGQTPLKPASILKLLIASVTLDALGPYHRFHTELLAAPVGASKLRLLRIKGSGDPSLVQEELFQIARELRIRGIREIAILELDDAMFIGSGDRLGQRAYEAGTSALSLNYNALGVNVCTGSPGQPARLSVEPVEYGAGVEGKILTVSRGLDQYHVDDQRSDVGEPIFSVGGKVKKRKDCFVVWRSVSDPVEYLGKVFTGFLRNEGISVGKALRVHGATERGLSLLYEHESKTLTEIIRDLNLYSNNFIAEQLLFQIGRNGSGKFDREKGLTHLEGFLQKRGLWSEGYILSDASGLSHENRVGSGMIARLIRMMLERADLRVEFLSSLPVYGKSGTLKKRRDLPENTLVRAKTGSIRGVQSLAGLLHTIHNRELIFALIQNGFRSRESAERIEKQLLGKLRKAKLCL